MHLLTKIIQQRSLISLDTKTLGVKNQESGSRSKNLLSISANFFRKFRAKTYQFFLNLVFIDADSKGLIFEIHGQLLLANL